MQFVPTMPSGLGNLLSYPGLQVPPTYLFVKITSVSSLKGSQGVKPEVLSHMPVLSGGGKGISAI